MWWAQLLNSIIPLFSSAGAAAGDYESIATTTVGAGGASSITFSSIPSTYKHLQIRGIMRVSSGTAGTNDLFIQFNSDTAANYSRHALYGTGSTAGANGNGSTSSPYAGRACIPRNGISANIFGVTITDILDYANTFKYKTIRNLSGMDDNSTNGVVSLSSASWQNTNAITSITLFDENSYSFSQYSSFALFGIKG
jgi:hypothetical protein